MMMIHSVTGLELAAADGTGLQQQLLHRSTAQLMEQPDTGNHAVPSMTCWLSVCVTNISPIQTNTKQPVLVCITATCCHLVDQFGM